MSYTCPDSYQYPYTSNTVFGGGAHYSISFDGAVPRTYGIDVNGALEPTKLSLPGGGYIRYEYANNPAPQRMVGQYVTIDCSSVDHREISAKYTCSATNGSCPNENTTSYSPSFAAINTGENLTMDVRNADGRRHHEFRAVAAHGYVPVMEEVTDAVYQGESQLLRSVSKEYYAQSTGYSNYYVPQLKKQTTTLADTTGAASVSASTSFEYMSRLYTCPAYGYEYNQQTVCKPTDTKASFPSPLVSRATVVNFDGAVLLDDNIQWAGYDDTNTYILGLLSSERSSASDGSYRRSDYEYDVYRNGLAASQAPNLQSISNARGNRTGVIRYAAGDQQPLSTTYNFDDAGNVLDVTDPKGNVTSFSYADRWSSLCFPSVSNGKGFRTVETNALGHSILSEYNYCTGTNTAITDPNNQKTTFAYDDYGRGTRVDYPDGGWTTTERGDNAPAYERTTRAASSNIISGVDFDGLNRPSSQWKSESGGAHDIRVDKSYDAVGRLSYVSNPYRQTSYGGTNTSYDALSRVTLTTAADATQRQWFYSGNTSYAVDEANHATASTSDSLGRLISLTENSYVPRTGVTCGIACSSGPTTSYSYDVAGNLRGVSQPGMQISGGNTESPRSRSFSYDGLSRLITANNPESGIVCYGQWSGGNCTGGYDGNGNLLAKTDARGVTANYVYDALNRVTRVSYTDGTRSQYFGYDGKDFLGGTNLGIPTTNAIGRLVQTTDSISISSTFAYDPMGRLTQQEDVTGGLLTETYAHYDLVGNPTIRGYPSGRQVRNTYDSAGRLSTVNSGSSGAGYAYISSIGYHPNGAPSSITYGNGVTETIALNSRLQPCQATMTQGAATYLDRQYFYGMGNTPGTQCNDVAGNNGNIWNIGDGLGGSYNQSFTYDALNRIKSWTAPNMAGAYRHMDYLYDSFGNLMQSANGTNVNVPDFYDASNRRKPFTFQCTGLHGETGGYDAAGNALCSGQQNTDAQAFVWNAANRISQLWSQHNNNTYNQTAAYLYNAMGERVRAEQYANGNVQSWRNYVHFDGQVLAEMEQDGSWADYIYANGKRIARADNYDQRIVLEGDFPSNTVACSACGSHAVAAQLQIPSGLTVGTGDQLHFRQAAWAPSSSGGIYVSFCDGTTPNWISRDQYGELIDAYAASDVWRTRVVDLSAFAGKQICYVAALVESTSGPGHFSIGLSDIAITRKDGSTLSLFARDPKAGVSVWFASGGASNLNLRNERGNMGLEMALPQTTVTYYAGDQVGTTSLLLSADGWPTWKGEFSPFGQELGAGATANRYKFTGKERDTESGLDYFGARYYASSMGRWMSPDWADKPEAVPYSQLDNPQSLNLYGYVNNNPLSKADPDGHCPWCPALAGAEILVDEAPLAAAGPAGWAVIGVTALGVAGYEYWVYQRNQAAPGSRPGQDFTRAGKKTIDQTNAAQNGGDNKCTYCKKKVKRQANKKGEPTPDDQLQRHHIDPKSNGGSGTPENGEVVCPGCHADLPPNGPTPTPSPAPTPAPAPTPTPTPEPPVPQPK